MTSLAHAAHAAETTRTHGTTTATMETAAVRARLDFDQSSNTVDQLRAPSPNVSVLHGMCAPAVGQEHSLRDARASEQQALEKLEVEWARKLQAPLDELVEFEHTVSQAVTELHAFLARC